MLSPDSMRSLLASRAAAFAAGGGADYSVLEEAETGGIELDGRPVILLGAGSVIAQPFVAQCIERCIVIALIDNGSRDQNIGGLIVQGAEVYPDLVGEHPAAVSIICCGGSGGMAYFEALAARSGVRPLNLYLGMRRVAMADVYRDRMWLEYASPERHLSAMRRRDLGPSFADDDSRKTYYALLLYRLTWDRKWLAPIVRPAGEQYFHFDRASLGKEEVLIDGGAYTGDSVEAFIEATGGHFSGIHAFEPDPKNFAALAAAFSAISGITLYRKGLWRRSGKLGFSNAGTAGSQIVEEAGDVIDVVALDDLDLAPTFIKLDVEGAELAVLEGARNMIRRCRPRFAVCVYHRIDDLWDAVAFFESLDLGYRFALRHYSDYLFDTILYAY